MLRIKIWRFSLEVDVNASDQSVKQNGKVCIGHILVDYIHKFVLMDIIHNLGA